MICSTRPLRLAALTLALVFGSSAIAAHAQSPLASLHVPAQANRVPANPDFGPQTQLTGHLPGWVNAANQVSTESDDLGAPAHVTIVLARDPAVQASFEQFLATQQSPGNPLYHQWLTPQQVGSLFGPTASDLAAVTSWLTSQGLTVESVAPNQVMLEVSGTDASIGNAFRTTFSYFNLNGTPRRSAVSEPSIPTALAPVVKVIFGLTDIPINPLSKFQAVPAPVSSATSGAATPNAQPDYTSGSGNHYMFPNDFAAIYDINSVYAGGNTGGATGTGSRAGHVAIIGRSRVAATDISEWATVAAVSGYTLNTIIPTTGTDPGAVCTVANASTCTTGGDQGEQTLDVDRVVGTVPGAQTDLVVSLSSRTQDGVYIAAAYNVNTLVDPVMTISYGSCELNSNVTIWDTLFSAGAAEGISTFVSAGDSGADGCAAAFTATSASNTPSPNSICSSSYDTCVGGTEFADTTGTYWSGTNGTGDESALSYIPEGGWNEPTNNCSGGSFCPQGTGGGPSIYITKPTWQTGTGVLADGDRDTPDVAYPAANHDGYYACLDFETGSTAHTCTAGYAFIFSGTSAAAPAMAGVAALLNTKLGVAQGNLNPLFYRLAASHPSVFHDVTVATSAVSGCVITTPSMCNNSTPGSSANSTTVAGGVQGYLVGTGYDMVTGLGSIDVANLLSSATTTVSTTLAVTAANNPISAGATDTFTATLTRSSTTPGAATGTVQFYSNGTAFGSAVTISNNVAVSIAQAFPTAGTYAITAVYSGDTNYTTSTSPALSLTVNSAPTFSVVPTTTSYSLTSGATTGNTDVITVSSLNSFAGGVTLTCAVTNASGTAAGSCAVAPGSVTLASGGTSSAPVLTITTTPGTSGALNVTVTGTSGTTVVTSSTISVLLTASSFTLTPSPTTLSLAGNATANNTTSVTITSVNGFAGTVTVGCASSVATIASCTGGSAVVAANGTAHVTVTVSPVLHSSGTANLTLTGTGTTTGAAIAATATATVGLTVTTVGTTTTVVAAPATVVAGSPTTLTATITPSSANGNVTGSVVFTVNGTNIGTATISSTAAPFTASMSYTPSAASTTALTVVATYSGDSGYSSSASTSTGQLTVSGFTAAVTTSGLSFTSGATTGNTDVVTFTSVNGFAGTINVTCVMSTGSAAFPPTCAPNPTSVTLTAGGSQITTISVGSTIAQARRTPLQAGVGGWGIRGGALLATLLCLLPFRRRRAFRPLAAFALLLFSLAGLAGCGGGGNAPAVPKSSAGSYTATVTATSTNTPAVVTTSTFTVTIN